MAAEEDVGVSKVLDQDTSSDAGTAAGGGASEGDLQVGSGQKSPVPFGLFVSSPLLN